MWMIYHCWSKPQDTGSYCYKRKVQQSAYVKANFGLNTYWLHTIYIFTCISSCKWLCYSVSFKDLKACVLLCMQIEVLEETRKMIPDCERRLVLAWDDLSRLLVSCIGVDNCRSFWQILCDAEFLIKWFIQFTMKLWSFYILILCSLRILLITTSKVVTLLPKMRVRNCRSWSNPNFTRGYSSEFLELSRLN